MLQYADDTCLVGSSPEAYQQFWTPMTNCWFGLTWRSRYQNALQCPYIWTFYWPTADSIKSNNSIPSQQYHQILKPTNISPTRTISVEDKGQETFDHTADDSWHHVTKGNTKLYKMGICPRRNMEVAFNAAHNISHNPNQHIRDKNTSSICSLCNKEPQTQGKEDVRNIRLWFFSWKLVWSYIYKQWSMKYAIAHNNRVYHNFR